MKVVIRFKKNRKSEETFEDVSHFCMNNDELCITFNNGDKLCFEVPTLWEIEAFYNLT